MCLTKREALPFLFVNSKFDISDDVLDAVGAELGTVRREDRVKKEYQGGSTSGSNSTNNNKIVIQTAQALVHNLLGEILKLQSVNRWSELVKDVS